MPLVGAERACTAMLPCADELLVMEYCSIMRSCMKIWKLAKLEVKQTFPLLIDIRRSIMIASILANPDIFAVACRRFTHKKNTQEKRWTPSDLRIGPYCIIGLEGTMHGIVDGPGDKLWHAVDGPRGTNREVGGLCIRCCRWSSGTDYHVTRLTTTFTAFSTL